MIARPPQACCYIRCSHIDSAESGLGLEVQQDQCQRYHAYRLPEIAWGGFFVDEAVSAYKKPVFKRPEGARLNDHLLSGDHVIVAKLDRFVRDPKDFCVTWEHWQSRGIALHIVDLQVDLTTPTGEFMAHIMASCARLFSAQLGVRMKESAAQRKLKGQRWGGSLPIGYKEVTVRARGNKTENLLAPDHEQLAVLEEIERLRDEQGMGWTQIALTLDPQASAWKKGSWNRQRVKRAYEAAKQIRADMAQVACQRS
jgi:DNA invertase Pin-like site-specific DNA recombinase